MTFALGAQQHCGQDAAAGPRAFLDNKRRPMSRLFADRRLIYGTVSSLSKFITRMFAMFNEWKTRAGHDADGCVSLTPALAAEKLGKAADNAIYAQTLANEVMASHPELVVSGCMP